MAITTSAKLFHSYYDAQVSPYHQYVGSLPITIQERILSYQFYSHFHPYVADLVKRLIEQSVSGLQAADTEYSTLAQLSVPTSVQLPDKTIKTLFPGELVVLPDGMSLKLLDGTFVSLSGDKVLNHIDKTSVKFDKNQAVTLLPNTAAKQLNTRKPVIVINETQVTLVYGKPLPMLFEELFSPTQYNPSNLVQQPYPVKDLDFTSSGAYSVYNWELFFHVPITVAIHLSKNGRFAEAQQWFHYIFDPTDDSNGPTPERFWKVKPFQYTDVKLIEDILVNLSANVDPKLRQDTINSIHAWKDAPFRPHVVARYRQTAYMFKTVMAYLDNLIDWGDTLFRQDTGESINEATMLYVLAANILGPRPQAVPKKGSVRPQTYASLRNDLNEFGNALRQFEADIPFDGVPHPTDISDSNSVSTIRSLGTALYFGIPRNDKLLSYWDTVVDRLFKIRNSLNIQGIFRQLPLFEPPIDPALLAKAAAAGLDVGTIISGINQPLPLVRFQFLVQKAAEICQEVKSLGNNLLSAIEKEDNEAFALLRAKHERVILGLAEAVRYSQWQEAIKSREGLEKSLAIAIQRYTYYERQLGKKDNEIQIPQLDALDTDGLEKLKFKADEPEVKPRPIEIDIATGSAADAAQALNGGKLLSSHEVRESLFLEGAQLSSDIANILNTVSSAIHVIPEFKIHAQPLGVGGTAEEGGSHFGWGIAATANAAKAVSERLNFEARRAARIDGFARRERDWTFQSNLAAGEITQIFKQLRAAQIREAVAEREWHNHQQQIRHAEEIERFLNGENTPIADNKKHTKTSTQDFYTWMKREVKGLYGQVFQFAFDIAKKAERALQHELGSPELSFLQFGYLSGKEGLLAGEKLYLDIKRMEMAYHDLNQREYELTKHVSLLQVSPLALLQLRTTGRCTITLSEDLFDLDCPGHYFRRIKSVAVSIPCVVGSYTSINCTLTLLKSSIRKNALLLDGNYARDGAEDNRFSDHFGSSQSIVTSSGQNDSGLFETNLRDERYLPFENSGVISEWQLELPNDVRQFDYDTISDVILHLRYTAREGGGLLQKGAITNLKTHIEEATAVGSIRLFSIRHEFPTEWAKFKKSTDAELTINIREEHFPYWSKGRLNSIKEHVFYIQNSTEVALQTPTSSEAVVITQKPDGKTTEETLVSPTTIPLPQPPDQFTLKLKSHFSTNSIEDLWLAVTWGKAAVQ
ncbi:insecticidal toxin protein [Nostoc sp. RF31YmG]|nr:insecticidal toxin protein [Nostoc sp. RF31YmG]